MCQFLVEQREEGSCELASTAATLVVRHLGLKSEQKGNP